MPEQAPQAGLELQLRVCFPSGAQKRREILPGCQQLVDRGVGQRPVGQAGRQTKHVHASMGIRPHQLVA